MGKRSHEHYSNLQHQEKTSKVLKEVTNEAGVFNSYQNCVTVSGQQAFQVGVDTHLNRRMIEINLKHDGGVTYKTVGLLTEGENKSEQVREYDPNRALELSGIGNLTPA